MLPIKTAEANLITESYRKVYEAENGIEPQDEPRNLGLYWHGGGYPGCTWEPNFGYFDANGEWHASFVTGYRGFKTTEEAKEALAKNDPSDAIKTFPVNSVQEFANMVHELQKTVYNSYVSRFADALRDDGIDVTMECTKCGKEFRPEDWNEFGNMHPEGYNHGLGGIASGNDEIWCGDCHSANMCASCGEEGLPDSDSEVVGELDKRIFNLFGKKVCTNCISRFLDDHPEIQDRWDEISDKEVEFGNQVSGYRTAMKEKGMTDDEVEGAVGRQMAEPSKYYAGLKSELDEEIKRLAPADWT